MLATALLAFVIAMVVNYRPPVEQPQAHEKKLSATTTTVKNTEIPDSK